MREAFIVYAKRTPVGKVGGVLKNANPEYLASEVLKDIVKGSKIDPTSIDDVILGNVVGPGGNIARLSALSTGLPLSVPGMTIDRQCGSGLEAVITACRFVQAGAGDVYLAGGVESTSRAPWRLEKPNSLYGQNPPRPYTRARFSPDSIGDPEMGVAAENVAERYQISREDQDKYACNSHKKAVASIENGRFNNEIVPIGNCTKDECPRSRLTIERLSKLPSVFKQNGTVTVGNACPINDGAAIVLVLSREKCEEYNLSPILKFIDSSVAGVDPNFLGTGPIPAVQKLLTKTEVSVTDINLVEFNEAFASQVLASLRELHIDESVVNVGGGALALGHPYGASGAILVTRLFHEMKARKSGEVGLATLGIGGGIGLAALFERIRP
jgi:acetyl-CoA C-acetyltransferase